MDPHLQKFIQQLRSVTLSDRERAAVRSALVDKIREGSAAQPVPSPWAWFLHAKSVQVAFLLLIIVISYGGTVTLASENSLPGEPLYPVKTFVAEPLARLMTANTPADRANFETKLLNERLKEAEELDSRMKLDTTLRQTVREGIRKQSVKAGDTVQESSTEEVRPVTPVSTSSVQSSVEQSQGDKEGNGRGAERALRGVLEEHKYILEELDLAGEDDTMRGRGE